ncbi:MAG: hypothetical protein CL912_30665 [Deltaproteobacteria bacterium]|nr:hypothetical protein [Deltaproteobacteria bacterium]
MKGSAELTETWTVRKARSKKMQNKVRTIIFASSKCLLKHEERTEIGCNVLWVNSFTRDLKGPFSDLASKQLG